MVANSRLDAKSRANEKRIVIGAFAPDAAAIEKYVGICLPGRSKRNGIFNASHDAAVSAEQAFCISADAVHAADIELLSRRQVLGAAELSVQAGRNHLSRWEHFLV